MDDIRLLWGDIHSILSDVYDVIPKPSKDGLVLMYEDVRPLVVRLPTLLVDHFLLFFVPLLLGILALLVANEYVKKSLGRSKTVVLAGPSGAGKTGLFAKASSKSVSLTHISKNANPLLTFPARLWTFHTVGSWFARERRNCKGTLGSQGREERM
jgi:hypothetical protein